MNTSDDAALRRPENRNPLWIDESEFGKVEQRSQRIRLPIRHWLVTGLIDVTGSKAVHHQGDIAPPCYKVSNLFSGAFEKSAASVEIDNGRKRTASIRLR
jgi:hypothetical protein